jgi:hypothetical protein
MGRSSRDGNHSPQKKKKKNSIRDSVENVEMNRHSLTPTKQ